MNIKDQTKKERFGGQTLPKLHGHTKIILTDVKTGKEEVIEKDNLVTGAVALLFADDVYGAKNYKALSPLKDMYGGVLCFEDELNTNAVIIPAEADNVLTAHAGQTSHSSASTTRGNPNGVLSQEIQDGKGYRYVWDFSTSQGNGQISSLSLVHKWLGDIATKPVAAITDETLLFDNSNKTKEFASGGDYPTFDQAYTCLLDVDFEHNTGLHVYLADSSGNTTLVVNEISGHFLNKGINDELGECKVTATHSVTLTRAYRARNSAVCYNKTAGKIYVVSAGTSAGHTLYVDAVDTTSWTATNTTITESSMNLGFFNDYGGNPSACAVNKVIVSDGYIYIPDSTKRTFYKINLTNTADITLLTSTLSEDIVLEMGGMVEISEGLIYGWNFIINGNNVYPSQFSANNLASATSTRGWSYRHPVVRFLRSGAHWYEWVYELDSDYGAKFYLSSGFPLCYLGTIQNLGTPVTKTSDKTMQIQYSLTIVE